MFGASKDWVADFVKAHVEAELKEKIERLKQDIMERLEGEDIAEKILSTHTAGKILGEKIDEALSNDGPLEKHVQDILNNAVVSIDLPNT
jgi:hypothetical protein